MMRLALVFLLAGCCPQLHALSAYDAALAECDKKASYAEYEACADSVDKIFGVK